MEYIEDGVDALVEAIREHGTTSIAIPPLGCGNGGLDWADVRPVIEAKLSVLDDVDVVLFAPKHAADAPEHAHSNLSMTYPRAILLKALNDLEHYFDGSFDRISLQKKLPIFFKRWGRLQAAVFSQFAWSVFGTLEACVRCYGTPRDDRRLPKW